jgi:hypothetical protein
MRKVRQPKLCQIFENCDFIGFFVITQSVVVFQPAPSGWKTFFLLLAVFSTTAAPVSASEADSLLTKARLLYYDGLKDKAQIEPAIELFAQIGQRQARLQGRAQTYIGSLTAIKAKHAFWPHQKWKWAKRGLHLMDAGLAQNPTDIESLFIHAMTCYYLPKFFGRSDDAQRHLRAIITLLPENAHLYDPKIMANVIKFLLEKVELTDQEREYLMMINARLAQR